MLRTDGGHDTHGRMNKVANFLDVALLFCAHLADEHFAIGFHHFTHRADNAERGVEASGSHQCLKMLAENALQIVLGARLAIAAGDAHHLKVGH